MVLLNVSVSTSPWQTEAIFDFIAQCLSLCLSYLVGQNPHLFKFARSFYRHAYVITFFLCTLSYILRKH